MESWLTRLGVDVCLKGAIAVLLETSPRPDTLGAAIEVIVAELRTTCSRQHPTHLTRSGAEDWTPVAMARSEEVGEERKDDVLVEGDWIRVVVEDNVVRGRQLLLLYHARCALAPTYNPTSITSILLNRVRLHATP